MLKKEYQTERLILRVSRMVDPQQTLDYYKRNEALFTPLDPKRPFNFYTLSYQRMSLEYDDNEWVNGHALKLWVFPKDEPQKIIGMVSFSSILGGSVSSTFLAYKLDQEYLNKGYITEAIAMGIKIIFDVYKLNRIDVAVLPRNKPSLRVMEKLGFTREGFSEKYLEINGVWEDHVRFGMVNDPNAAWRSLPIYQQKAQPDTLKVKLMRMLGKQQ